MKPANFAPVYAALYPKLAEITREHGYALAIHGSMARDFDLACLPWADTVSSPDAVVEAITSDLALWCSSDLWTVKNHGRIARTIHIEFGQCAIDLSFMPSPATAPTLLTAAQREAIQVVLDQAEPYVVDSYVIEVRELLAADAKLRGAS
jgi:hypothetical protein